jgi:hypothetical protein
MAAQDDEQKSEDEVTVFLNALGSALAAGKVYVEDADEEGRAPYGREEVCGWRAIHHAVGDEGGEPKTTWLPQGSRVGWLRGDGMILIMEAAYSSMRQFLGRELGITKRTLIRRLAEAGAIADSDPGKNVKTLAIYGESRKTLVLKADHILVGNVEMG